MQKILYNLLRNNARELLWRLNLNMKFIERILFQLAAQFHLMIESAHTCKFAFYRARSKGLIDVLNVLI